MKKLNENIRFIILILIMFCGLFYLIPSNTINSQNLQDYTSDLEIKSAGYWTNFSYIHITNLNWSTAASYDWCTGDGSWDTPYVLENFVINASTSPIGCGILIENSSVYFRIENCTIFDAYGGGSSAIRCNNVSNATIIDNNCSNNDAWGGIHFYGYLGGCNNNTISGNIVNDNLYAGIVIEGDNNLISGNTAKNNPGGNLGLLYSNHNNITGNTVSGGAGIYLYYSDINTLTENLITNCVWGIVFDPTVSSSDGNLVYNNQFINNTIHALDNGTNNQWNLDIGNYWDDYGGVDLDDDGIGDTPYTVGGSAGTKDYFPIWDDGDEAASDDIEGIPFGETFLIFSIIAIISLVIYSKRKRNFKFE